MPSGVSLSNAGQSVTPWWSDGEIAQLSDMTDFNPKISSISIPSSAEVEKDGPNIINYLLKYSQEQDSKHTPTGSKEEVNNKLSKVFFKAIGANPENFNKLSPAFSKNYNFVRFYRNYAVVEVEGIKRKHWFKFVKEDQELKLMPSRIVANKIDLCWFEDGN